MCGTIVNVGVKGQCSRNAVQGEAGGLEVHVGGKGKTLEVV